VEFILQPILNKVEKFLANRCIKPQVDSYQNQKSGNTKIEKNKSESGEGISQDEGIIELPGND
jgi:hypothetical protein